MSLPLGRRRATRRRCGRAATGWAGVLPPAVTDGNRSGSTAGGSPGPRIPDRAE
jgi:hypothetical protein